MRALFRCLSLLIFFCIYIRRENEQCCIPEIRKQKASNKHVLEEVIDYLVKFRTTVAKFETCKTLLSVWFGCSRYVFEEEVETKCRLVQKYLH
jgi:hypothetical protein